ncbi:bifunctional glycosyltransferase/CDP-glycerol:glycerophosphate glycerophosphotransferase [Microlunatus elymi]|uniref:bifunctional glycosyltransferase/CDP-glycerol:glycerophosphate glycerophosphotransferase n=1 Tax=Microlunatus elymi TaxID=2596828 RepID=UPI00143D02C0|nr:CDP-glycerol glycerophosphotransferase family protein [Microlunatus elymi]
MLADARKQSRQLARRLSKRLPASAQRGARNGWRRLRPYAKRVFYSRPASPLVSIVIPIYNVERYLPACLDSVLSQSYPHLQVIVVDDGSPDDSYEVARGYADSDRRVQIVRQPNAGLGAARNTGARHARGTFLMFMDSDDVLRPDAIRTYVRTLRQTGSDFAVGSYDRLNSNQTWPAAWWIRSAHRFSRLRTNLVESPDICVNAVAWSKFYRRSFYDEHGFAFPEGVLYEDQALSARVYATARQFDILAKITYGWRVREDRSSITQQSTDVADLRARLHAAENSLAELAAPELEEVRQVRLAQYLSNDFPLSIKTAQHADDAFWELLTDGLKRLTADAGPEVWRRVSAQHRVAIRLVIEGHRDAVIDFIGLGHNNPKNIPSLVADGNVYLQVPARRLLGLGPTDPLLALAEHQLGLVSSIRRAHWDADHRFHIEGWAYIDNVDLAQCDTATTITAIERNTGFELDLDVELRPSIEVTQSTKHRFAHYEPSWFHAVLDLPAAIERWRAEAAPNGENPTGAGSDWQLRVTVASGGLTRTGTLAAPDPGGSAGRLQADFLPDGQRVEVTYSGKTGLLLAARRPACTLHEVALNGRRLALSVVADEDFRPHQVEVRQADGGQVARGRLTAGQDGVARTELTLPPARPSRATDGGPIWEVSALTVDGSRSPIHWPPGVAQPSSTAAPILESDRFGALVVNDRPVVVRVDRAVVTAAGLQIGGRVHGTSAAGLSLRLLGPKASAEAEITEQEGNRFAATIQLQADPWALGRLPLPMGDYVLMATRDSTAQAAVTTEPIADTAVQVDAALVSRLPVEFRTDRLRGQLRIDRSLSLGLRLVPPLADGEVGARNQQRLQDELRNRLTDTTFEPGAVLLRSYYGEICGCNPRALHEYLHNHPETPGSPYKIYWAIKDYSVHVPDGGIPVLHDSTEWYRLLHDAQYYMDNMHQPLYHKKPAHQTQIQTFHGYPFKQMGLSHWTSQGRDIAHIQSYLDRAADWDYLISPATYGTGPLAHEFGYPHKPLEIGYPRNDIFFSPHKNTITTTTRQRLGIQPHQTAILYAPTFRDALSLDDNTAAMVDHLDLNQLTTELGPNYVILVRGHAFNARLPQRINTHTTTGHHTIIDVTDYPDIAELCLASDAAILDYSSLRFDYALTGKPMIFMVPDLHQYQNETRGSLWRYEPTAPGPLATTTTDIIKNIHNLQQTHHNYTNAYQTFHRDFLDLDDGNATQRLTQTIFGPSPDTVS